MLNRIANAGIRVLFRHGYNDTTNAFKAYRREVIETVQPLLSNHFNLTVELPLKAVVRGHSYGVVPISWTNRRRQLEAAPGDGQPLPVHRPVRLLERHLSRGDYSREQSIQHHSGALAGRRSRTTNDDTRLRARPYPCRRLAATASDDFRLSIAFVVLVVALAVRAPTMRQPLVERRAAFGRAQQAYAALLFHERGISLLG